MLPPAAALPLSGVPFQTTASTFGLRMRHACQCSAEGERAASPALAAGERTGDLPATGAPAAAELGGEQYVLVRPSPPPGAGEKPAETVLADLDLASQVALRARQRAARVAAAEQGPDAPAATTPVAAAAEEAAEAPAPAPAEQATTAATAAAAAAGVPVAAKGGVPSRAGARRDRTICQHASMPAGPWVS